MSVRTFYILVIFVYSFTLLFVFGYYLPEQEYTNRITGVEDQYRYLMSFLQINDSLSANSETGKQYSTLHDYFAADENLVIAVIDSGGKGKILKNFYDQKTEEIYRLSAKPVNEIENEKVLFLNFKAEHNKPSLLAGILVTKILAEYEKIRDIYFLIVFAVVLFSGFILFIFEKYLKFPINDLILQVRERRITGRQKEILQKGMLDLRYLAIELNTMFKRLSIGEVDDEDHLVAHEHDIDPSSSLAQMPLELKHETSKDKLLEKANELITDRYNFHLSIIYLKSADGYHFHNSNIKSMKILNDRLAQALSDNVMQHDEPLLKKLSPFRPYVTSVPHFNEILESLNLRGHFAYQPIAADGILIVGYLDEQVLFSTADLNRVTAMANYIILSLIDHESINRLRHQIKIKTSELEAANEMLANSIKNKDMMLKLISHDLHAPLRNVFGLIDSIQRKYGEQLNPDIKARLERIRNNITKEISMISDILENFKAVGKSDSLIAVNVTQIIRAIQNGLQYELDKKKVKLVYSSEYPVIYSDPYIVEHIFLNLIDNACKYFDVNGQENKIIIEHSEDHRGMVFKVIDNGDGIPEDKLKLIQDHFNGKHGELPKGSSGIGLGLALTKSLVDKIDGRIEVKSMIGQGCAFTVIFKKIQLDTTVGLKEQG
ncbi:MAG: HAMP domain-containing histidine kinase [Calditrichaceae bacterium]|nr:HAMP domain-containing histidine kinase [Calditrichaceae bacterium]RQV95643.1 MAG: sensor histidine kinase [Calditrichota bacterium]